MHVLVMSLPIMLYSNLNVCIGLHKQAQALSLYRYINVASQSLYFQTGTIFIMKGSAYVWHRCIFMRTVIATYGTIIKILYSHIAMIVVGMITLDICRNKCLADSTTMYRVDIA